MSNLTINVAYITYLQLFVETVLQNQIQNISALFAIYNSAALKSDIVARFLLRCYGFHNLKQATVVSRSVQSTQASQAHRCTRFDLTQDKSALAIYFNFIGASAISHKYRTRPARAATRGPPKTALNIEPFIVYTTNDSDRHENNRKRIHNSLSVY